MFHPDTTLMQSAGDVSVDILCVHWLLRVPVSLQMLMAKWSMWCSVLPQCPCPPPPLSPARPSLPTTTITTMCTICRPMSRALWWVPSPSHPTSNRYLCVSVDLLLAVSLPMLASACDMHNGGQIVSSLWLHCTTWKSVSVKCGWGHLCDRDVTWSRWLYVVWRSRLKWGFESVKECFVYAIPFEWLDF